MAEKDFDDILISLRTSKWNLFHFFIFGLVGFTIPSLILSGVFLTPNMEHKCQQTDEESFINSDECTFHITPNHGSNFTKACTDWTYQSEYFPSSITQEMNLVCDRAYLRPLFLTVYMLGNLFGAPINGYFSDKFGRRFCMLIALISIALSSVLITVISNINAILVLRFIMGFSHPAALAAGYILCLEICQPKHRSAVGIIISLPWAIGTMWYGTLGYLVADWRWLQRIAILPLILALLLFRFFCESPRWLIVNGHFKEAMKILRLAGKWNNSQLPPEDEILVSMEMIRMSSLAQIKSRKVNKHNGCLRTAMREATVLFKTKEMRKITLLLYFPFFAASTVFYGLSINSTNFNLDPYMYMIVGGLMEVPAYSITIPIIKKFGRVLPTVFSYIICGIAILALAFIPSESKTIVIILAMLGKLFISSAYQFIYLIASEAFPTECRMQGIGTSQLISRFGSTAAPYITDSLISSHPWVPSVIFGTISILAGFSSLFIPETLNIHLPETIAMLDESGRSEKVRKAKATEAGCLEAPE